MSIKSFSGIIGPARCTGKVISTDSWYYNTEAVTNVIRDMTDEETIRFAFDTALNHCLNPEDDAILGLVSLIQFCPVQDIWYRLTYSSREAYDLGVASGYIIYRGTL